MEGLCYRGAYEETTAAYAMIFAKGSAHLQQEINEVLLGLKEEGVLAEMRSRWFKTTAMLIA